MGAAARRQSLSRRSPTAPFAQGSRLCLSEHNGPSLYCLARQRSMPAEALRLHVFEEGVPGVVHMRGHGLFGAVQVVIFDGVQNGPMLLGGGLAYTLGLVVYKLRRLPYNHAIWHLFVLAGSVLMISGVYFCML